MSTSFLGPVRKKSFNDVLDLTRDSTVFDKLKSFFYTKQVEDSKADAGMQLAIKNSFLTAEPVEQSTKQSSTAGVKEKGKR